MHLALDRPLRATRLARARRCRLGLVREHGGNGDAQNNRHRHRYDERPPDKDLIHACHTHSVTPVSPSRCALTHARWGSSRSFRQANSIEPSRTRTSDGRLGLPRRVAARGHSATTRSVGRCRARRRTLRGCVRRRRSCTWRRGACRRGRSPGGRARWRGGSCRAREDVAVEVRAGWEAVEEEDGRDVGIGGAGF